MRKANTTCRVCNKGIYRRPFELESYGCNVYCSKKCMYADRALIKTCPVCRLNFKAKPKQTYCSKQCSGKTTRNRLGTKKGYRKQKNLTEIRLEELRRVFDFKTCMVQGCNYDRTFDIHRLVPGKDGGQYTIGNMYAICPNHHAECHRGLIWFTKISDYELAAHEMEATASGYATRFAKPAGT